jgi:hypothetical protein
VETLPDIGGPALVVYEDKKMPRLIADLLGVSISDAETTLTMAIRFVSAVTALLPQNGGIECPAAPTENPDD